MKIGFTGSQGTGKTVSARMLAHELDLPFIEHTVRDVAAMHGIYNVAEINTDPRKGRQFQKAVLTEQIARELEYVAKGFVTDRTVIDNVCYWNRHHAHGAPSYDNFKYYMEARNHVWTGAYDLLIYTPVEFPLVKDEFRSGNKEYQQEFDLLIQTFMCWQMSNKLLVVHGRPEERLEQILDHPVIKGMKTG